MALFRSRDDTPGIDEVPAQAFEAPRVVRNDSLITAGTTVTGDLYSRGKVEVRGRVRGNIACRDLVLGEAPEVESEITAESVSIRGHFDGRIRARKVILTHSATVTGEIAHSSLEIQTGAVVEGEIRIFPASACRTSTPIWTRSSSRRSLKGPRNWSSRNWSSRNWSSSGFWAGEVFGSERSNDRPSSEIGATGPIDGSRLYNHWIACDCNSAINDNLPKYTFSG